MSSESALLCEAVLSLAATYWLHSTVLLGGVLLWLTLRPTASHLLQERLWKFAATAGFITAGLQTATGAGIPLLKARNVPPLVVTPSRSAAPHEAAVAESSARLELTVEDSLSLVQEAFERLRNSDSTTSRETIETAEATAIDTNGLETQASMRPLVGASTPPEQTELQTSLRSIPAVQTMLLKSSTAFTAEAPASAWLTAATLLLVAVSAAGLLWFCVEWLLFWHTTRRLQPATWQQLKLLDDLRERLQVRQRIELLTSDRFSEPVAFGLWQWKIVLPTNLDGQLSDQELTSLLAHEIAHLARGDVWWLHIGRLLTSVLAWQPLNFVARRRWQLQAEFQSDDWAIRRSVDPVSLARCLTIVAEWRSSQRLGAVALPAGGSRSHITERVERLLEPVRRDKWATVPRRVVLALAFASSVGSLVLVGPRLGRAATEIREQRPAVESLTDQQLTSTTPTSAFNADPDLDGDTGSESQLRDESTLLALEISLLAEELAELESLLTNAPESSGVQSAVNGLRQRLSELRAFSASEPRPLSTPSID